MSSTRKLLQRRFCCCCVNELGTFKNSNEPTVVLTKSETITSQPGAKIKVVSNGTSNGGFNRSEEVEQLQIAGFNNEFDEIDLNGDVHQSTSTDPNKAFLKPPGSSAAGSSRTSHTSSDKSKSTQLSVHNKELAENLTDMMFNEICERAETIDQEIVEEENFERDLHAVSEATEDEISDFEATSSRQKPIPSLLTLQNNNLSKLNVDPEDFYPRSLSSETNQPLSASSSSLKSTGRDLDQQQLDQDNNNDINYSSRTANSVPNTPSSTTSSNLPPKPPRKDLHSSVEQLTAGVLPINENGIAKEFNGISKEMGKPSILPKPNGLSIVPAADATIANSNVGSRMYGGDDSSDESESKLSESKLSSSPFSLGNDEVQELKKGMQTKTLDKRNGKHSKNIEQFDYKALETDLSERTN